MEVTLALGVVSVSLLSLIGLLPAGLGVLRESMDQTVHATIVQRVASGLTFADIASLGNQTLVFDQEGRLLDNTDASEARYVATIQESTPSLPGLDTDDPDAIAKFSSHLTRLRIGISRANVPNSPIVWHAVQVAAR